VSRPLLIVKLGGDAVASPATIAAAADRIATLRRTSEVVVVASARRGVTDRLLALVQAVASSDDGVPPLPARGAVARERAIASGEIVAASLVAVALAARGLPAEAVDARQAGIRGAGAPGAARIRRIATAPLRRRLQAGVIPVVAGFQVADRGQLRLLARGGSDVTAVALGAALVADEVLLFKQSGLRHADPRVTPTAAHVGRGDYAMLRRLIGDGAPVLHPEALHLAERHAVPLAFVPFPESGPVSRIAPITTARAA
jgi:aspartate kinase